jgi:virginiamycin B lyase
MQTLKHTMILLVILLMAAPVTTVLAAGSVQTVTPYPVPGSPYHVAVEQPGRIWTTLPAENAIVRLVVTLPGVYGTSKYQLPTAMSEPYDIAYAAGAVWVTEQTGNKIARFDPLTETWTEFAIPTPNSLPTGLVVLPWNPGNPVEVWFCERAGNKLGQLLVSESGTGAFAEFPLPIAGAAPESVDAVSSEAVWFTAPSTLQIVRFQLSRWSVADPSSAFLPAYTESGSRPFAIKLDPDRLPWFTEPGSNRLGRFAPGTLTIFEWYWVPRADSELAGLDYALGSVWFTGKNSNQVGRLTITNFEPRWRLFTLPKPGSAPTDIAVDSAGCAWIAASGVGQIIGWCAPYFNYAYLPGVYR